jgi:hypothetical protein
MTNVSPSCLRSSDGLGGDVLHPTVVTKETMILWQHMDHNRLTNRLNGGDETCGRLRYVTLTI